MKLATARLLSARVTPKTEWLFLQITDATGMAGWGECSLDGQEAEVAAAARQMLPGLVDAALPGDALLDLLDPADLPAAAVASALCQAARDIAAQHTGQPLSAALGGPIGARVPLYANINRRNRDRAPETMAASARLALAAGYDAIKIAPFDEVTPGMSAPAAAAAMQPGLARIAKVREAIGPEARLMIDCHWRFDAESAAAMIRAAAVFDPWWIECPIPETPDTMPAIRDLRGCANALGIRLAGLEMCVRVAGFRPWIDAGTYDVMMPDVKYCGGPDEMLRIAQAMAAGGVTFSPHNPTGPICHLHAAHVCAAVPEADLLEHQFDETPLFHRLVAPPLPEAAQGAITLTQAPGIGAAFDETAHPVAVLVAAGGSLP